MIKKRSAAYLLKKWRPQGEEEEGGSGGEWGEGGGGRRQSDVFNFFCC